MKKYADKKRSDIEEYKVGDLVMLSTKDLKYQMVGRRTEKLTERFVGPYKIKEIVSSNAVNVRATRVEHSRRFLSLDYVIKYVTTHLQEIPQRIR